MELLSVAGTVLDFRNCIRIKNIYKKQCVRRSRKTGKRAVKTIQNHRNLKRRPIPGANLDQCAGENTHHVVEKTITVIADAQDSILFFNRDIENGTHR